jgi:hypothetical protein
MLQRHVPAQRRKSYAEEAIALRTRIALWKCVRRDRHFLSRSGKTMEELAQRLHIQAARARLRADHAQELNLPDLTAADRWWKKQWRQEDTRHR